MSGMVSGRLLPHGKFWPAHGIFVWSPASGSLDDWVIVGRRSGYMFLLYTICDDIYEVTLFAFVSSTAMLVDAFPRSALSWEGFSSGCFWVEDVS